VLVLHPAEGRPATWPGLAKGNRFVVIEDHVALIGQLDRKDIGRLVEARQRMEPADRRAGFAAPDRNDDVGRSTKGCRAPPGVADVAARLSWCCGRVFAHATPLVMTGKSKPG
jgi:hypothetical protein